MKRVIFRSSRRQRGTEVVSAGLMASGPGFRRDNPVEKFLGVLAVLFLVAFMSATAFAVEPDEVLADPVLEARALDISRNLRCVVCQSQSIDESNAPLAKDMRVLVRERLSAGDSDADIYTYLVQRYGDYVLLKPPVQQNTILLWAAPALIFVAAGFGAALFLVRMKKIDASVGEDATNNSESTKS